MTCLAAKSPLSSILFPLPVEPEPEHGHKPNDGSWQEINFPSQGGCKLKLAHCDWPGVRSQCAWRPQTESAALYPVLQGQSLQQRVLPKPRAQCAARHTPSWSLWLLQASAPPSPTSPSYLSLPHINRRAFVFDSGRYIIAIVIVHYTIPLFPCSGNSPTADADTVHACALLALRSSGARVTMADSAPPRSLLLLVVPLYGVSMTGLRSPNAGQGLPS